MQLTMVLRFQCQLHNIAIAMRVLREKFVLLQVIKLQKFIANKKWKVACVEHRFVNAHTAFSTTSFSLYVIWWSDFNVK